MDIAEEKGARNLAGLNPFSLFLSLGIVAFYVILVQWFHTRDFYHTSFFDHGASVTFYQVMRLLFMPYLAWMIYAVGVGVATLLRLRTITNPLPAWERYPLLFLIGAGVWHVALFPVGLAGFYNHGVAYAMTLAVMVFSLPHMARCLSVSRLPKILSWHNTLVYVLLFVTGLFLITKGTYPAGGHDYYNHYFQFYKRVIETGSTLPNDVWYHFYYCKGAGLYFIAMLLTDPLAPQLVTSVFFLTGGCIVYAMAKRHCTTAALPLVAVILYVLFFIYTPGPSPVARHGGWGDLEKIHELTTAFIFGIVWLATQLFVRSGKDARPWILALHLSILSVVLMTATLAVLLGVFMGGLVLLALAYGNKTAARDFFFAGASTVLALIAVFAINYHYTGLPLDQTLLFFWKWSNLAKVESLGWLHEIIAFNQDLTGIRDNLTVPWSWDVVPLMAIFLRLDVWGYFLLGSLLALVIAAHNRTVFWRSICKPVQSLKALRLRAIPVIYPLLIVFALAVVSVLTLGGGRAQAISSCRLSSFSYGPMLILTLLLWDKALLAIRHDAASARRISMRIAIALFSLAMWVTWSSALNISLGRLLILRNAERLWVGAYSLKDAYQNQQGWPGRMPWGGIYPGIEEPWRIAGPHTRIWSMHVHSYCMLPDCNMQGIKSFRFSSQWENIYLGTPEAAISQLKSEGLNYFFFSSELQLADTLPGAPLFAPENIKNYLGIRWSDGTSYLLTWLGSADTRPIDDGFLTAYNAAILRDRKAAFDAPLWREVSKRIHEHPGDLTPITLPW